MAKEVKKIVFFYVQSMCVLGWLCMQVWSSKKEHPVVQLNIWYKRSPNQNNTYSFNSKVKGEAKNCNWMHINSQVASSAMILLKCHWTAVVLWQMMSFPLKSTEGKYSHHVSAWKICYNVPLSTLTQQNIMLSELMNQDPFMVWKTEIQQFISIRCLWMQCQETKFAQSRHNIEISLRSEGELWVL